MTANIWARTLVSLKHDLHLFLKTTIQSKKNKKRHILHLNPITYIFLYRCMSVSKKHKFNNIVPNYFLLFYFLWKTVVGYRWAPNWLHDFPVWAASTVLTAWSISISGELLGRGLYTYSILLVTSSVLQNSFSNVYSRKQTDNPPLFSLLGLNIFLPALASKKWHFLRY